jgi:hypothetical protein
MTEDFKAGQIVIVSKEVTGNYDLIGQIRIIDFDKLLEENLYYVHVYHLYCILCVQGKFLSSYPENKEPAEEIMQDEKSSTLTTSRIIIESYMIIFLLASIALNIYQFKQINLIEKVAFKLLDEKEILIEQRNSDLWKKLRENNSKKP